MTLKTADSPIHSAAPAEGARAFAPSYLLAVVVGALGVLVLFGLALVALESVGRLPPPQIANNLCVDEKLRFLRASPAFDAPRFQPDVLAVGSSVSWRTFDGEAVERASGGRAVPFNGGFCGLKVNETAFTTRYFIERYPTVRDVVMIVAPQDLTECKTTEARLFDPEDANRYIYGDTWVFPFYLKYFDPVTFVKNIYLLSSRTVFRWGLVFDRFGGSPIDTRDGYRDSYGTLGAFDPMCFEHLHNLAAELHAGGRRLVVATMPLHPTWIQEHDPKARVMPRFEHGIRDALSGTSAVLWIPGRDYALQPEDFVDAIHIRWSAARDYSRALVEETGLGLGQRRAAPGGATNTTRH